MAGLLCTSSAFLNGSISHPAGRPAFSFHLKPIRFIPFRHGSSRALIQDLLFPGLPLWKSNFAEVDFGIQGKLTGVPESIYGRERCAAVDFKYRSRADSSLTILVDRMR
jgi:hypothetical protein